MHRVVQPLPVWSLAGPPPESTEFDAAVIDAAVMSGSATIDTSRLAIVAEHVDVTGGVESLLQLVETPPELTSTSPTLATIDAPPSEAEPSSVLGMSTRNCAEIGVPSLVPSSAKAWPPYLSKMASLRPATATMAITLRASTAATTVTRRSAPPVNV
jgi:hypothetical protein